MTKDSDALREALEAIVTIVNINLIEKPGAHRVKWEGNWIEGPAADMVIQLLSSFRDLSCAALATPASDVAPVGDEAIRLAYVTGYNDAYSDTTDGMVDHDAAEEGWGQYQENLTALAHPPAHPVDHVAGGEALREALRNDGWMVAVHNDYRLNGEDHTFWLFTHPDGRWIKGEGRTDNEALTQCLAAIKGSAA